MGWGTRLAPSGAHFLLLCRALAAIVQTKVRLRRGPYVGVVDRLVRPSGMVPVSSERAIHVARRYSDVLESVSRVIPAPCLERSLALQQLLSGDGVRSELRIGVRKERERLSAHAWVEIDGEIVSDSVDRRHDFVVLSKPAEVAPARPRSSQ